MRGRVYGPRVSWGPRTRCLCVLTILTALGVLGWAVQFLAIASLASNGNQATAVSATQVLSEQPVARIVQPVQAIHHGGPLETKGEPARPTAKEVGKQAQGKNVAPGPIKFRIAPQFSDNMVLQRNAVNCVWGYTPHHNVEVTVAIDPAHQQGKVGKAHRNSSVSSQVTMEPTSGSIDAPSQARWEVCLPPMQASSTVYTITASSGRDKAKLQNVLIGDVWLCSGQSNMQFPFRKMRPLVRVNSSDLYAPNIRLLLYKKDYSLTPQTELPSQWWLLNRHNAVFFSAVCLVFGLEVFKALHNENTDPDHIVPLGLISNAISGTLQQAWAPGPLTSACADVPKGCNSVERGFNCSDKVWYTDQLNMDYNQPGVLWNALMAPLVTLPMTGLLWYQGESNGKDPLKLQCVLSKFIHEIRKQWPVHETPFTLPFIHAMVSPYYKGRGLFPYIRNAQILASLDLPSTAIVNTLDTGDPTSPEEPIHSRSKIPVGIRMARAVLQIHYKTPGIPSFRGPEMISVEIVQGSSSGGAENGNKWSLHAHFITHGTHDTPGNGNPLMLRDAHHCRQCCKRPPFDLTSSPRLDPYPEGGPQEIWTTAVHVESHPSEPVLVVTVVSEQRPTRIRLGWEDYPECLVVNRDAIPANPKQLDIKM